jgi:hypothetical protein
MREDGEAVLAPHSFEELKRPRHFVADATDAIVRGAQLHHVPADA